MLFTLQITATILIVIGIIRMTGSRATVCNVAFGWNVNGMRLRLMATQKY